MKIRSMGAEFIPLERRKDGRTDSRHRDRHDERSRRLSDYASAPNKLLEYPLKNVNAFYSLYPSKIADRLIAMRTHGTELTKVNTILFLNYIFNFSRIT
jgi:hypothetical protein